MFFYENIMISIDELNNIMNDEIKTNLLKCNFIYEFNENHFKYLCDHNIYAYIIYLNKFYDVITDECIKNIKPKYICYKKFLKYICRNINMKFVLEDLSKCVNYKKLYDRLHNLDIIEFNEREYKYYNDIDEFLYYKYIDYRCEKHYIKINLKTCLKNIK